MDGVFCELCHWYGGLVAEKDALVIRCDHPNALQEQVTPLAVTMVRQSGTTRNEHNDCADFTAQRVVAYVLRKYGLALGTVAALWLLLWLLVG